MEFEVIQINYFGENIHEKSPASHEDVGGENKWRAIADAIILAPHQLGLI